MNNLTEILNSGGEKFVEFAVPMLIQSSVLIVILLAVDLLLQNKVRATFRYWLWMLVLVKLVLPPTFSSPVSLGRIFGDKIPAPVTKSAAIAETYSPAEPLIIKPLETSGQEKAIAAREPIPADSPVAVSASAAADSTAGSALSWQAIVLVAWAGAAAAMAMLVIQRLFFVLGLIRQAQPAQGLLTETLRFCRKRMAVNLPIRLKVSANATSPAVCGLFRPVILVPQDIGPSLGPGHLRPVLMHELGHIKRGDLWVNLVQTLLQIIYFYNPMLWPANAVIRRIREQAVDEMVQVAMGNKAQDYPETLLNVAKLAFGRPALALRFIGVVESKSQLQGRIKKMLNQPIPKRAKLGFAGLLVIICAAALLLPMAAAKEKTMETKSAGQQAINDESVRVYQVNRSVADFAKGEDLSSPESAYATINRLIASGGGGGWARLSVERLAERFSGNEKKRPDPEWAAVLLNAQILEVRIFDGWVATVMARLPQEFTDRSIIRPIDVRNLELQDGRWLNVGNDRVNTLEEAQAIFRRRMNSAGERKISQNPVGKWRTVDFVEHIEDFEPGEQQFRADLYLKGLDFNRDGTTSGPWTWKTGSLYHPGDKTTAKYVIKEMGGDKYLFMEWMSGDVTIRGRKPDYYVLKKIEPSTSAGASRGKNMELANDDGQSAGKWSFSGGGHGVKFTAPAKTNLVTAVRIYGSRYGEYEPPDENFDVWICDENYNIIENFQFPYSTFEKRGDEKWATLEIEPTKVGQNFAVCVAFDPHQTKGIYVYHDAEGSGHSYQGIPPEMKPFKDGDWLVRAVVQPLPEDEIAAGTETSAKTAVQKNILANDDGKNAGKWSFSGGGHGVKFTAPSEGCVLKAVKFYGSRYGEYEPPKEDFDVWLCDKDFNIIKNFKFPYSMFAKRGYTKWATLDVDDIKVPKDFAICVAFDPHQTKGIYVYHDAKGSGHSYQGIPPEMKPFGDGDWMIRAVVETPGGKAASGARPSRADRMEAENLAGQAWKLWAERKLPEAEDLFRQAVEKDPTNANAWNGLGWAQQNQGKKENARYSFERCLELEPMQAAALNGLGWIAKSEGQTDKAIEYWKKAVRASGGNATASLSGLTQTFMELEQYDQAIKYYEMWLKVEPNNEQVKQDLQQAMEKR